MEVEQSPTTLCGISHSMFGGTVQNATTDGIAQTISGLTPNIAVYTFRVAAVVTNQMIGPFSNPVNTSVSGKCSKNIHMYALMM